MAANLKRNLIALAGASIGAATLCSVSLALWSAASSGAPPGIAQSLLVFIASTAAACFVVASTIGVLWHMFVKARGWRSVHAYWPPAALVGAFIPAAIIVPGLIANHGTDVFAASILKLVAPFGAALGGFTGLFFWLIRRPDRDAPNPPTPTP